MDEKAVAATCMNIEGWLSENEGLLLFNLAKGCSGAGVIVEIGSWRGRSTAFLAYGSLLGRKGKVYAVDPQTGTLDLDVYDTNFHSLEAFVHNIRNVGAMNVVVPVVKKSWEAAAEFRYPIELLFIDGSHDYDDLAKDFDDWTKSLIKGGVVAIHDSQKPTNPESEKFGAICIDGPHNFVENFLKIDKRKEYEFIGIADSITYFRKA